jgi:hypothetical protein
VTPTLPLPRIGRKYVRIPLTATDDTGQAVEPADVAVAVLPYRRSPTADTTWTPVAITDGRVRVLLAGPDAPAADGALPVPDPGGDLYLRVQDQPEIDTVLVTQIAIR